MHLEKSNFKISEIYFSYLMSCKKYISKSFIGNVYVEVYKQILGKVVKIRVFM
jgi:hypothetical protein